MLKKLSLPSPAIPFRQALNACRRHFIQVAIFSALLNLLYLTPSLYMLQIYDRVVPTRGITTLLLLTLLFVVAAGTSAALDLMRSRILVHASSRLDRLLSTTLLDQLTSGAGGPAGAQKSFILREFDNFRQTMTGTGMLALLDLPWAPIYILVCFLLHPALGLMALVGAGILLAIAITQERVTAHRLKDANSAFNQAYHNVEMSMASNGVIRSLGMRKAFVKRHGDERKIGFEMMTNLSLTNSSYVTSIKFFRQLLQSFALGLGAWLAIYQQISPGAIFAASLLIARALAPIEQVTGAWKSLVGAKDSYDALNSFSPPASTRSVTKLPQPEGRIEVRELVVRAPNADRLILDHVSFALNRGDVLGVVGPSGAGKSTLVKAIAGAIEVDGGVIRVDGASLKDWPEDQIARAMGYLPQEASLFRATVKDNISRFDTLLIPSDELDEEVIRAATRCGAHDFILRLPKAYETDLGWGGAGLSVGQAQRIALARALYGGPAILILDEPNANLDADGEERLKAVISDLRQAQVTIIIVAHRMGILAEANKLIVLRDGRVDMFGESQEVQKRLAARAAQLTAVPTVPPQRAGGAA